IQHIVDGDHRPSSPVTRLRLLAIPKLRLGNVSARLHESILIEQHLLQTALAHEKLHLRERLVPVEIRVVYQRVPRPPHAEPIQIWKIIRVSAYGRNDRKERQRNCRPVSDAYRLRAPAAEKFQHAG